MDERKLVISGRYDRLEAICEFVVRSAEAAGLDDAEQFHCQIAVDEACTNIIEHAYEGEGRGDIEITCRTRPGEITIVLDDHGKRFDPDSIPAPHTPVDIDDLNVGGLGLFFIRKVMDDVRFSFGPSGNRLELVKRSAHSNDK